jgi:acetylornithine deacetylase/succinyl-diaminopimelate desuccinylase-like protein
MALVCDTGMWDRETLAITTMLRGLVLEEVIIHAADRDLHSGVFGGAAINPIHVLARIVADLHDEKGRVTLPGFYNGVAELPEDIAEHCELCFQKATFWAKWACQSKSVLPAQASAKFSFRLVGSQDPDKIDETFRAFVKERLPADCRAEFVSHGASGAVQLPFSSEALSVLAGRGASIPIVGAFKCDLGMDTLMIGFGLEDDRIHSPNEKYELSSFHKGTRSWARVLSALAL